MNRIDLADPDNRVLGHILRLHAEGAGDTPFLLADSEHYTYAQVNSLANRYASGLRALGVATGDRVLVFMHSCVEFVVLALAANKLGAVWVPVNTDYKGDWLADAINDSKGAALAVDGALLPRLQQVRDRVAFGHLLLHRSTPEQVREAGAAATLAELATHPDVEPDMSYQHYGDTAAVLWTSGTTGKPKGVMQSHNVWIRAAENANRDFGTSDGDIAYNCLPLYNSAAWVANIYRALVAGIPCAIDDHFSVHAFWDRIRFYGATQTMTLGAMHMFLWNEPPRADDADNPLRMANMVPMPERLLRPFCEHANFDGSVLPLSTSAPRLGEINYNDLASSVIVQRGRWLLTPALGKIGLEGMLRMRDRVAAGITTTFASHYAGELSLAGALDPDAIRTYGRMATGEKYLIRPDL